MGDCINKTDKKSKWLTYRRHPLSLLMYILVILSAVITVGSLGYIVVHILVNGIPHFNKGLFALEYNSDNCSMLPSIVSTLAITLMTLIIAVPFGIGSAVYLVEYANKESFVVKIISVTTETLAGIPSIVYGLFGMLFFVYSLQWGKSILAGAATLAIMVLPVIMRTTQEALIAVPVSYREGSFALGVGKLRTIFKIILPSAMPGILSGVILATGRIVGETAALMYTAGTSTEMISGLLSSGRTLSVHMYSLSREGLHTGEAYATAVVLLVVVILINMISSTIAKKISKQ